MHKNIICRLTTNLFFLLCAISPTIAQVTIGDGTPPQKYSILEVVATSSNKGGLRLPQLTSLERDNLTDAAFKTDPKAEGLTIFNLTTKCYEYWNGTRWVSLCKGNANISFKDEGNNVVDITATPFACVGESRGAYTPHDTPDCTTPFEPYSFMIMVGDSYTSIDIIDSSTGKFELTMAPNPTASSRNAIIRVINNCTGELKEFLIMQEGCTNLCQPSVAKPNVTVTLNSNICSTGAVYMSISNIDPSASYIWTLNDQELTDYRGRGYCIATQSGTYRVYVGAIGCEMNASDKIPVTINGDSMAPNPVEKILVSNGGVICSGSSVKITALNVPTSGTLTWYKNGLPTSKIGNPITVYSTEVGDWFAVMTSGLCTSKPSNIVTVSYDSSSSTISTPVVSADGIALASAAFCKGGYTTLNLDNAASYTNAVTVNWYNGETLLGTGTSLPITIPYVDAMLIRCQVHDNTGLYCDAETSVSKTISSIAPERPSISGNPYICGGSPAILSTTAGGASYVWYKNNTVIPGATAYIYTASEVGDYKVQYIAPGGCRSQLSPAINVKLSDIPNLVFISPPTAAGLNEIKTFQVQASSSPTSYVWSVSGNGVSLIDGSAPNTTNSTTTTSSMRVQMGSTSGTVMLTCYAVSICGNSTPISVNVAVGSTCTSPSISTTIPEGKFKAGANLTMSVVASGSAPLYYSWKRNGTVISSANSYTISNASTSDAGTYNVTVTNSCGSVTSESKAISIINLGVADGSGKVTGTSCFDINTPANNNSTCGLNANRNTADFSRTYIYTFTNTGTGNTDLSWYIEELPSGSIIESTNISTSSVSGSLANGANYTITVKFKESLMTDARGTTDANAFKANIYALYKTNGVEKKSKLEVVIKDCMCGCGAKTSGGGWLVFMCHNLGADQSLDPFTWKNLSNTTDADIKGWLFQWGRKPEEHQMRNSSTTTTLVTFFNMESPSVKGRFITSSTNSDWVSNGQLSGTGPSGPINRWTDTKGQNDPCPDGWRVPTAAEWQSITGNGEWNWTGNGYMVGERLYLPAPGYRQSGGTVTNVGMYGGYWSSTAKNDNKTAYRLTFGNPSILGAPDASTTAPRISGMAVRCVQE